MLQRREWIAPNALLRLDLAFEVLPQIFVTTAISGHDIGLAAICPVRLSGGNVLTHRARLGRTGSVMGHRVDTLALGFVSLVWLAACERAEPSAYAAPREAQGALLPSAAQAAALTTLAKVSERSECPAEMALVEGDYCPNVELHCRKYLDPEGRYQQFRCAEYGPSTCKSKQRRHLRFCIDKHEYVPQGETLPANHKSFTHAEKLCTAEGKRVCRESEWNFACEGEEMRPYPYGFARDASACNADRADLFEKDGSLRDLREPPGAHPRCASPFGVLDLSGNLEEFVAMDRRGPAQPAMKGSYWQPGRNFCRAAQTAHDRYYNGTETGFRCCAEPR